MLSSTHAYSGKSKKFTCFSQNVGWCFPFLCLPQIPMLVRNICICCKIIVQWRRLHILFTKGLNITSALIIFWLANIYHIAFSRRSIIITYCIRLQCHMEDSFRAYLNVVHKATTNRDAWHVFLTYPTSTRCFKVSTQWIFFVSEETE